MSTTTTHTIQLHRVLRATPERIYRAFLDADALVKWLPPHGFTGKMHQMDAKVGGTYTMSFTNFTSGKSHAFGGTYLEHGAARTPALHGQVRRPECARRNADDDDLAAGLRRHGVEHRARRGARCHPSRGMLSGLARITHTARAARRGGDSRVDASRTAEHNHWSERRRATPVAHGDATDRLRCSVRMFGMKENQSMQPRITVITIGGGSGTSPALLPRRPWLRHRGDHRQGVCIWSRGLHRAASRRPGRALWPRGSIAHDVGLAVGAPSPTKFTLGHHVLSKAEVDAVITTAAAALGVRYQVLRGRCPAKKPETD